MTHFRPISLCNTVYKIISKILVNCLRPLLPDVISPFQIGFVKGRKATDNYQIANEVSHSFRSRRGKGAKLDIEKAYDRLSWSFIHDTLAALHFLIPVIKLIMSAISSVSYKILWNGEASRSFAPRCGLRQGDPLSPYIFILCLNVLSVQFSRSLATKQIHGFKVSRSGPALTHLLFADDILLFGRASPLEVNNIMNILHHFFSSAGLSLSIHKSKLFISKNTPRETRTTISNITGFLVTTDLGQYLGLPLLHGRVSSSTFSFLIDKLNSKLSSWKISCLFMAARVVLVKFTLSAILVYASQALPLSASICEQLDHINRNFIWGHERGQKRHHLINWRTVCLPKGAGGIGVRQFKKVNLAFFINAVWRLWRDEASVWAQTFKNKYFPTCSIWQAINRPSHSVTWKYLLKARDQILQNIRWLVGHGNEVSFWHDNWCCGIVLRHWFIGPLPKDCEFWKVADCLLPTHHWDTTLLSSNLPQHILDLIYSVPLSDSLTNQDIPYWPSHSRECTTKDAYAALTLDTIFPFTDTLIWLWKLSLPPNILIFLWKILHNRLATKDNLPWIEDKRCALCHSTSKSGVHVLRDCFFARTYWRRLNIFSNNPSF